MVSWKNAFKKALFTVLYSLGSTILGIIILILGSLSSISYDGYFPEINYLILIPSILLGGGFIALGSLASFYKVFIEFLQEEMGARLAPLAASKLCPNCGIQNRSQARICKSCGAQLI